jgi:hypothetical protein
MNGEPAMSALPPPAAGDQGPAGRRRPKAIGAAIVTPVLLIGVLAGLRPGARPPDSGLAVCTSLSGTRPVTAADYPKIRSRFAGSRWPDLRADG